MRSNKHIIGIIPIMYVRYHNHFLQCWIISIISEVVIYEQNLSLSYCCHIVAFESPSTKCSGTASGNEYPVAEVVPVEINWMQCREGLVSRKGAKGAKEGTVTGWWRECKSNVKGFSKPRDSGHFLLKLRDTMVLLKVFFRKHDCSAYIFVAFESLRQRVGGDFFVVAREPICNT